MQDSKPPTKPPSPQWVPPARLHDPYVRRMHIDRARWMRTLRGRIPKALDAAVATYLATYGNKDGSRNFPGVARLAADLFLSESTVKRSLSWLTEHGWISCAQRGVRWAGMADVYQLCIPAPLAVEMGIWPEDGGTQWMERPAGAPKRAGVRDRRAPVRQGRQGTQHAEDWPDNVVDIGVRKDDIGVCNESQGSLSESQVAVEGGDRCPSLDTPPGLDQGYEHQVVDHPSELPARPHADARGAEKWPIFDPDDVDVAEKIIDCICERYGPVGVYAQNMVDSMLAEGRAIPRILNAVAAAVRDGTDMPA